MEIKLGDEVYTCRLVACSSRIESWTNSHIYSISVEGYSKRALEIADAKALVNKTKEAHKEAQRKLAELTEGK